MSLKPELTDRANHLLKTLINEYIQRGQPIGSGVLAHQSGLKLSASTIRNAMASLEAMGLIRSPYTSSGRIPTSKGYRLFVDSLLQVRTLNMTMLNAIKNSFNSNTNKHTLIQSASCLLSSMTQMAGVVTIPQENKKCIKHIEFLCLSETQLLAILVLENGYVQNRLVTIEQALDISQLQSASRAINQWIEGKTLTEAKESLSLQMKALQINRNACMYLCIALGEQMILDMDRGVEKCVIAGKTNLVSYDDLADMNKLRELFNAFSDKHQILNLLESTLNAEGVQIFIGKESGNKVFDDLSLVTTTYSMDDDVVGVLGVIGPKRMQYDRIIPMVDVTARLLTASLKSY